MTLKSNFFEFKIRPKKLVLFPEIGRVKIFLSPTLYFLFQKNKHKQKNSTNKFIGTNLRFIPSKQ